VIPQAATLSTASPAPRPTGPGCLSSALSASSSHGFVAHQPNERGRLLVLRRGSAVSMFAHRARVRQTAVRTGQVPRRRLSIPGSRARLSRLAPGNGAAITSEKEIGMPTSQVKSTKIAKVPKQRGSKAKPARITSSSASSSRSQPSKRSGTNSSFNEWSKEDLMQRARQEGISGRSSMNKSQLVSALRKH
jgi:hypothetical protein